jgi:hypothetical protein
MPGINQQNFIFGRMKCVILNVCGYKGISTAANCIFNQIAAGSAANRNFFYGISCTLNETKIKRA